MSAIDKYIDELRRSGDTSLILLSESEARLRGKSGERALEGKISHKIVTALVEEIVPPECFADLVMMEPVEFPLSHEAGELSVRVVPGPSIWRVVVDVRGEGLAPMPADKEDGEEAPSQTWQGLGSGPRDLTGKDPPAKATASSANPLEEALGEAADGSSDPDNDVPLSEALLADQGESLDDGEEDIDLASFLPSSEPAAELHSSPTPSVPLDQDQRSTKRLQEGEPGADPHPDQDQRSTKRLQEGTPGADPFLDQEQRSTKRLQEGTPGADPRLELSVDLDPGPGDEVSSDMELMEGPPLALSDDGGDEDPSSAPVATSSPSPSPSPATAPAPAPVRPVEPLEYDFDESAEPRYAIDGLDPLLEAAWKQGATALLLRDERIPLTVRGGLVSELPFAKPDQGRLAHDIVDMVASPSQAEQLEIMGQCRFVYRTGSDVRVRCTLVQDGGVLAASVRRIGDEHLPAQSEQWMSEAVRKLIPPHGLLLVCGAPGHGKTTTAAALTALSHVNHPQTVVVADPLERRLESDGAGVLQRRIPDDVPNCAQALQDVHLLEAPLVLVDVPRPDREALAMLSLAAQGRLVVATWPAPDCVEAIQGLMDAMPPELAPAERARRGRNLVGVIAVKLVPTAEAEQGVVPLFEVLRTHPALLGAVAESRLDALRGTEIRQITFESSRALWEDRGLL